MRTIFVLTAAAIVGIAAACGGSAGAVAPPVDGPDSGEITTDAGGDAPPADAAPGSDASDASDLTPIVAPDDQWTWVDFPTSKCGSGTPTGIGVNPHAGATELLVFMEGGGSCMTGDTCWGPTPGASNMAGYGAAEFAATKQVQAYPIFNRALAANPLAATNMVFVPYCTGDLHDGNAEVDLTVNATTKPTYFYGGFDMDLFLARLVVTYPNMKRVILAGGSAGGFGTFLNFDKTVRTFGVRVDIIDDSGPPIPNASGVSGGTGVWNIELPQGCPQCKGLRDIYDADRLQQPNSRFGLMTFNRDSTIAPDFGYTVDQYPTVISTLATSIAADTNAAIFEVDLTPPAAEHVVESELDLAPSYLPWIAKLLNDDPTWASENVTPP